MDHFVLSPEYFTVVEIVVNTRFLHKEHKVVYNNLLLLSEWQQDLEDAIKCSSVFVTNNISNQYYTILLHIVL